MARPGATYLESIIIIVIALKQNIKEICFVNQVWARE